MFLQAAQKPIKASPAAGGDADCLAQYYREWAHSYELDVDRECYRGPSIVAKLAGAVQAAYIGRDRAATAILDAGCGLVGIQLKQLGFRLIDGFDLSGALAEMARETGVYRNVEEDILNRPLSDYSSASSDMTVCCGVVTLGHVHPQALRELARDHAPDELPDNTSARASGQRAQAWACRHGSSANGCYSRLPWEMYG